MPEAGCGVTAGLVPLGKWTLDLGHHKGIVGRLILKQTCRESCCSALELWQESWLGEGENRQEAGRTGQTMTTGTHSDEIGLKSSWS